MLPARLRPGVVDASLAALLFAAALVELLAAAPAAPTGAAVFAGVLTTLPLAWRNVAPVAVVVITVGSYAIACAAGVDPDDQVVATVAPMVALYTAGNRSSALGIAVAAVVALAGYVSVFALAGEDTEGVVYTVVAVVVALLAGAAVRVMGFESDALAARAAELERERDAKAREAVAAERARIARELHDVIGHSISVMGLHAGGVRRLLEPGQEQERRALLGIERLGRDAVAELHRLLGFLRENGEGELSGTPPTLERVSDLVAEMRLAGLDVELDVGEGLDFDELSPGRALATFRILQEALTNTLKHAPGAHVRATLRRTAAALEIDVVDDGAGVAAAAAANGGHGLVGMRERVAMYGGTLDAGPRDGRGFAVHARLPTGVA
jgi:signal transduction histidine kinase